MVHGTLKRFHSLRKSKKNSLTYPEVTVGQDIRGGLETSAGPHYRNPLVPPHISKEEGKSDRRLPQA